MAGGSNAVEAILFVNLCKENAAAASARIREELEKLGTKVTVFSFEGKPGSPPEGRRDVAFSLGGDGTVLYAARTLAASGTPILPVQLGTFGFISSVGLAEWADVYRSWLAGKAILSPRCMFEIMVERGGDFVYRNTCLNDAVVSSMGIAKLIRLGVRLETSPGRFADLGRYRADGLVVATPTGSTAYSMAAGGPIVDPEMEARIVSPICPFSLANRPLVLPARQPLHLSLERQERSDVLLTVDGQDSFPLQAGDTVTVCHLPHKTLLVTSGYATYHRALREKLSWQGDAPGRNADA